MNFKKYTHRMKYPKVNLQKLDNPQKFFPPRDNAKKFRRAVCDALDIVEKGRLAYIGKVKKFKERETQLWNQFKSDCMAEMGVEEDNLISTIFCKIYQKIYEYSDRSKASNFRKMYDRFKLEVSKIPKRKRDRERYENEYEKNWRVWS